MKSFIVVRLSFPSRRKSREGTTESQWEGGSLGITESLENGLENSLGLETGFGSEIANAVNTVLKATFGEHRVDCDVKAALDRGGSRCSGHGTGRWGHALPLCSLVLYV